MAETKTILLVDDEHDLRDLLALEFEDLGFRVLQADSGFAGQEMFDEHRPDVILSDIRMPNGDGMDLLKYVKAKPDSCPVFLITGFADVTEHEALTEGASQLFNKPFDIDYVTSVIREAVGHELAS